MRPRTAILTDGRLSVTTLEKLSTGEQVNDARMLPWGGLFSAIETLKCTGRFTKYAGLRLVGGQQAVQMGDDWVWIRIYEDLHETDETLVGRAQINRGEDGRIELTQVWWQFSAARATPQKVGVSVCSVWPVTLTDVVGNAGTDTLSRTGGLASGLRDGDVVRIPTLVGGTGLNTATDYHVRDASADTKTWKLSATAGGAAINFTTDITAATILQQVTLVLAEEQAPDDGTLRRITRRFVNRGVIAIREVLLANGRKEASWTSVLVREDPPGVLVGDVDIQRPYGVPVYTVRALQALDGGALLGPVAQSYGAERPFEYPGRAVFTLREVTIGPGTYNYLGLFQSVPIQVTLDAMVTVRYSARNSLAPITDVTGTAATNRINIPANKLPAGWPLRVVDKTGGDGLTLYTVYYIINPTEDDVQISLTEGGAAVALTNDMSDATISLLEHDRWNPSSWAVLDAYYLVGNDPLDLAREKLEGLRGYRVAGEVASVTFSSATGYPLIAFGTFIATGYQGVATLSGGPPNPGGVTWTLSAEPEPDFVGSDGTTYYRHTIITAYVPPQEDLPLTEPTSVLPPP